VINELAKKDSKWREVALKICKDKSLADDLVNDMYLKVYDRQLTDINDSYIYRIIYTSFIDHKRKTKKIIQLDDFSFMEHITDDNVLDFRMMITRALEELHIFDCEVLLHTHERSLRDNEDLLGIQFTKLHYWKKRALEKIEKTEAIKEFKKLKR
jgi:DNA-directed RNA polymerase specialized sigma24 family protein